MQVLIAHAKPGQGMVQGTCKIVVEAERKQQEGNLQGRCILTADLLIQLLV